MAKKQRKISIRIDENMAEQLMEPGKSEKSTNLSGSARTAIEKGLGMREGWEKRQEMQKLIYEINKIGVNINQIVKDHNSKIYSIGDKEKLNFLLEQVIEKLENIKNMITEENKNGNIKVEKIKGK
ncbi:plasmid mobilization relaxosome protein MobC [Blautia pseudococcoides]|uniref:plasmid mobilization relaxosome protein MobC n=1 Tax=Blautia pseudococcoides TaxID=1796616 RepID=UPI003518B1F7